MIRAAVILLIALILSLPPLAGWFSATMPRHQLLQVPALIVLGAAFMQSLKRSGRVALTPEWNLPLLILAIGTILFWMVPRSVDLAANGPLADQLSHLSWFLAAATLALVLPQMHLMVSVALGIHTVAMLLAVGLVYTKYPALICTAYNLQQQHATGRWMLYAAPALGIALWTWAIRATGNRD